MAQKKQNAFYASEFTIDDGTVRVYETGDGESIVINNTTSDNEVYLSVEQAEKLNKALSELLTTLKNK